LGCLPDNNIAGKQQSGIHLFLHRSICRRGIAGARDDVFIEFKPIGKICSGLKMPPVSDRILFPMKSGLYIILIFRRQYYYRMRQIDARNRAIFYCPKQNQLPFIEAISNPMRFCFANSG
jgi:hypothetical protein